MPARDLLVRLHSQTLTHPSHSVAYSEFVNEWSSYISSAKYGYFDEWFQKNGYPIPDNAVSTSDYHTRAVLENELLLALDTGRDTIVLGNEGSGKTTLVHYVLGYKSNAGPHAQSIKLYIDARNLEAAPESFGGEVFSDILSQISALRGPRSTLADDYVKWYDAAKAASPKIRAFLEATESKYGLASLFAFLTAECPDARIFVAIDNIDSLSVLNLRRVVLLFESARAMAQKTLKILDRAETTNISFIVPCRKATWSMISSSAAGEFPFRNPGIVNITSIDDSIWQITKSYIQKRLLKAEEEGRLQKNLFLQIPVGVDVTFTPRTPLRVLLCEIADWINTHSPETEKLIGGFSGQSLRRGKMFALKVLGNSIIVQNWLSEWYLRERIPNNLPLSSETVTEIVREALFDAMQGIGDGVTTTEILLNPFGVIRDPNQRRENPYIGVVLMRLIRHHWNNIHTKTEFSDEIDFEKVFEELRAIGYPDGAIRACVQSFCISGVLRPIKLERILLAGADHLSTVYLRYCLDLEAFDLYWSLVFRTGKTNAAETASKENAILFVNACTRANYGVGYVTRPASELYRAFMNTRFLRDCQEGDRILETMISASGYKGQVESYVHQIFPSLLKKWRSVLSSLKAGVEKSPDDRDREMFAEANQVLDNLEAEQRRGGVPKYLRPRN